MRIYFDNKVYIPEEFNSRINSKISSNGWIPRGKQYGLKYLNGYFDDPEYKWTGGYIDVGVKEYKNSKNWAKRNLITFVNASSKLFAMRYNRFCLHWKVAYFFVRALLRLFEEKIFLQSNAGPVSCYYCPNLNYTERSDRDYKANVLRETKINQVWRPRTTSKGFPSPHTYGIAFDMRASKWDFKENAQYFDVYTNVMSSLNCFPWLGHDPRVVEVFVDEGFYWGGRFGGMTDGMHFEASVRMVESLLKEHGITSKDTCMSKVEQLINSSCLKNYFNIEKEDIYITQYLYEGGKETASYAEVTPPAEAKVVLETKTLVVPTEIKRETSGKVFLFG